MTSHRRRAAWAVIGVTVAMLIVALVTAVFVSAQKSTEIRDAQVTNTRVIENTDQVLALLLDCTDPQGECYQRGQDSQRRAIDDITVIAAAAAACANETDNRTVRAVLDCTLREIDAAR